VWPGTARESAVIGVDVGVRATTRPTQPSPRGSPTPATSSSPMMQTRIARSSTAVLPRLAPLRTPDPGAPPSQSPAGSGSRGGDAPGSSAQAAVRLARESTHRPRVVGARRRPVAVPVALDEPGLEPDLQDEGQNGAE